MAISEEMARAILGHRTDEVPIWLATISGSGFETFRVCNDSVDAVSNGQTFIAYPFQLTPPGDTDDASIVADLTIANVTREIWEAIEAATGVINIKLELILASSPNVIEKSFANLELLNARVEGGFVQGRVGLPSLSSEPYPHLRATPSRLPGLFFDD